MNNKLEVVIHFVNKLHGTPTKVFEIPITTKIKVGSEIRYGIIGEMSDRDELYYTGNAKDPGVDIEFITIYHLGQGRIFDARDFFNLSHLQSHIKPIFTEVDGTV